VSIAVTPCLSVESSSQDRLTFYQARIHKATGPFLVFQEVLSSDLEDLLNSLDFLGFEIFELAQESADPGYRSRWTVVAFRTRKAA
jgi:hypothetical protein